MKGYDDWKLTNPDDTSKRFSTCEHCGNDIAIYEIIIETDSCYLHEGCYEDYAWRELGARTVVAGDSFGPY